MEPKLVNALDTSGLVERHGDYTTQAVVKDRIAYGYVTHVSGRKWTYVYIQHRSELHNTPLPWPAPSIDRAICRQMRELSKWANSPQVQADYLAAHKAAQTAAQGHSPPK